MSDEINRKAYGAASKTYLRLIPTAHPIQEILMKHTTEATTAELQQQLRLTAIEAQLQSLEAQSQVLRNISIEHHACIDLGGNISTENYVTEARALVKQLRKALADLPEANEPARAVLLEQFDDTANKLKKDCETLIPARDLKARQHLDDALHGDRLVKPPHDCAIVAGFGDDLERRAHVCCYQAETGQMRTFVMQIKALCNLCLETLFNEGEMVRVETK